MKEYYRSYAEVHLDTIIHNIQVVRKTLSAETGLMAVVKADAYGHGIIPIAKAAESYVEAFAVAIIEEAVMLRRHGISKPILVLGTVPVCQYQDLLTYEICPTIFQLDKAIKLSEVAVKQGRSCSIHIGLDTGMSRLGMVPNEESVKIVKAISQLAGIHIAGAFTHFARADESDKQESYRQLEKYQWFLNQMASEEIPIPIKHCSNSAGTIDVPEAAMDMVRLGISMYGLYSSEQMSNHLLPLRPALALKSHISYVKMIESGMAVSYGGTFVATHSMKVATIPIGYGDGYPRNLSGQGQVLIAGKRANILGRVCMDQLIADVSDLPEVAEGDLVTLIGADGSEEITVEEIARVSNGFHYEILCNIGKRIPRVYKNKQQVIGTKDYFFDSYEEFKGTLLV